MRYLQTLLLSAMITGMLAATASADPPASTPPSPSFSVFNSFLDMARATDAVFPPVRAVTRGPKFHWFGYYDKFQFDVTNRYLLCNEVDFEGRLPNSNEPIKIGMVDLADNDKWIELAESHAWSWQQGCMLQWRPGSDCQIIFNDRDGDHFVSRIFDVNTRKIVRTLPRAIGHISPDGKTALCEDYSRLWDFRAGYGYAGIPDAYADQLAPAQIGVWRMDLETGECRLLVSVADVVKVPYPDQKPTDKHYINHLAWNPDGRRFLFFDRWTGPGQPTRVFTMTPDGQDLKLLSARGASHWTWRDTENVLIYGLNAYQLYKDDGTSQPKEVLWTAPNGHQTYIPGTNNQWLVTDTYPYGPKKEQIDYLYHIPTKRFVPLGRFPSTYRGEWRCDTHPRLSRDGKMVVIDSPHGGNGRQQYLINIAPILASPMK